ncbi:hypothetical protein MHU86_12597 [Fragilaria crotonensis]|nr:hypothetical protein MHU86_12597 [Fragilaria crotonensis]
MTGKRNGNPTMSSAFFIRILKRSMMAGFIIYGVVHELRSPYLCDSLKTINDSVNWSFDSGEGGALLMPETVSAGFSSSLSTDPSTLHPTELPSPETSVPKIDNVLLMGQFNYDIGVSHVRHWVGRWSEVFSHIEVRGAFSNKTLAALQQSGISAFFGGNERGGLYSPMKNVADSLRSAERMGGIVGVMYVHDDMMVYMRGLVEQGFPWDSQIAFCHLYTPGFSVTRDGGFAMSRIGKSFSKSNMTDVYAALNAPPSNYWPWWQYILPGVSDLAMDARFSQYFDDDGTFSFVHVGRSDFLYIPTRFTSFFSPLADLMTEKKIFLESAFPALIVETKKKFNASVMEVSLCQGAIESIPGCLSLYEHGLFHPIKIAGNVEFWDRCFDRLVLQRENVVIPVETWW